MTAFVLECDPLWVGDGTALDGHLVVADGRIDAVAAGRYAGPLESIRLEGMALSPGLIDTMVNGAFGESAMLGDLGRLGAEYLRLGVTAFQACAGNATWEIYERMAANLRPAMAWERPDRAKVLGVYSEGPFMKADTSGANLASLCQPATEENVRRFLGLCGETLTMVNVSPGIDNDLATVGWCREAGKVVTMCHSNAPAQRAIECVSAGISVLGHAFDNNRGLFGDTGLMMPTIDHAALVDARVRFIHLIADGIHVHPIWIRLILACRGHGSVCLVTDSLDGAGCKDGAYTYDDGQVYYKAGGVGRTADGKLFGSAMLLPDHFRNFIRLTGLGPAEAIGTVTLNPAASLGLENRMGRLAPGCAADLVAWDSDLRIRRVWRAGVEVRDVSDFQEIR